MKKIILILSAIVFSLSSCDLKRENVYYSGTKYDVVKVNDTTYLVVPTKNEDAKVTTIQINGKVEEEELNNLEESTTP